MQRVLIIAENSLQQERLCKALALDETVQLATANLRQINPRNLRSFRQADLVVLEDTSEQGDPRTTEFLVSSLKTTGLPIVLLPSINDRLTTDDEPLVLNLTEESIAKPGLAALINKIREHYVVSAQTDKAQARSQQWLNEQRSPGLQISLDKLQPSQLSRDDGNLANASELIADELVADPPQSAPRPEISSKVMYVLTSMGRISKQLREPLSNMNLAIHMLGRVQSIEERDRYVKLLREEYQRELQLVNELENLHSSLETIL